MKCSLKLFLPLTTIVNWANESTFHDSRGRYRPVTPGRQCDRWGRWGVTGRAKTTARPGYKINWLGMSELTSKYDWIKHLDEVLTLSVVSGRTPDEVVGIYGGNPAEPQPLMMRATPTRRPSSTRARPSCWRTTVGRAPSRRSLAELPWARLTSSPCTGT